MNTSPGSTGFQHNHGNFGEAHKRLVVRTIGVTVVVALIALAASQQATSSPTNSAPKTNHNQIQLDVVNDTAKSHSVSDLNTNNDDVLSTTNITNESATNNASSSVNITVNGQSIAVPENGSTQQTITTPAGDASVNISHNSNDNGTSFSSSFSSVSQSGFSSTSNFQSNIDQSFGSSP